MIYRIEIPDGVSPSISYLYSRFIFKLIKKRIKSEINVKRYKIREPYILKCSLIKWRRSPPKSIDLVYYINNCLEMVRVDGEYVIRLNEKKRVKGSFTKVSTLIRILEYGTNKLPPCPLIRKVFFIMRRVDQELLFFEFMKERFKL